MGDIAVLELDQELDLETYTPACLAKKSDSSFVGKSATAAGWGVLYEKFDDDGKKLPPDAHAHTDVPHEVQLQVSEWCREKDLCAGGSGKSWWKVRKCLAK